MNFSLPEIPFLDKINKKVLIIAGVAVGVAVVGGVAGVTIKKNLDAKKAAEAAANIDWSLKAYTLAELQGGSYYVKDGDDFYPVVKNCFFSTNPKDTAIPVAADPEHRGALFLYNDQQIPTLYRDSQLIYKSSDFDNPNSNGVVEQTPTDFYLERFKDDGYSIGILGLTNTADGTKYKYIVSNASYSPMSDAQKNLTTKEGQEVTIDKVNGIPITSNNVSSIGTILGLSKDQVYPVDAYIGTSYAGKDIIADTHFMSSYELYDIKTYTLDPQGFLTIELPDYLWTGYYYINGIGMFRYINGYKAFGIGDPDYNTPYYVGMDGNNNMITNPAPAPAQSNMVDGDTGLAVGQDPSAANTGASTGSDDAMSWHYDLTINNQQKEMDVTVTYSDAKAIVDGKMVSASDGMNIPGVEVPRIMFTDPSGNTYELTKDGLVIPGTTALEQDLGGKEFVAQVTNPETGTWSIDMTGMYSRTFNISTEYLGSSMNMIVKDGSDAADMTVYVPADLKDGRFKFTWEQIDHRGVFAITGPNGEKYTNNRDKNQVPPEVEKETFGEVDFRVGAASAGEYSIKITGEALGHLYFTYEDIQEEESQMSGGEVDPGDIDELAEESEETEGSEEESSEEDGEVKGAYTINDDLLAEDAHEK